MHKSITTYAVGLLLYASSVVAASEAQTTQTDDIRIDGPALPVKATPIAVPEPERYALVIANANYKYASLLFNTKRDAKLIAARLQATSYHTYTLLDGTRSKMLEAVSNFSLEINKHNGPTFALIFYAGHGMQNNGKNFLIPVDARISTPDALETETLTVDWIFSEMEKPLPSKEPQKNSDDAESVHKNQRINALVLDACRNSPFQAGSSRALGMGAVGLAQMSTPSGSLVAFSTAPGKVADDGPRGKNSLYAVAFSTWVVQPGMSIQQVFNEIGAQVMRETNNSQRPWVHHSLKGTFFPAGAMLRHEPSLAEKNLPAAFASTNVGEPSAKKETSPRVRQFDGKVALRRARPQGAKGHLIARADWEYGAPYRSKPLIYGCTATAVRPSYSGLTHFVKQIQSDAKEVICTFQRII